MPQAFRGSMRQGTVLIEGNNPSKAIATSQLHAEIKCRADSDIDPKPHQSNPLNIPDFLKYAAGTKFGGIVNYIKGLNLTGQGT